MRKQGHETADSASVICPYSGEFEQRLQALRCAPVFRAGIHNTAASESLAAAAAARSGGGLEGGGGGGGGGGSNLVPGFGGAHLAGPLPPPSAAVDVAVAALGGFVDGVDGSGGGGGPEMAAAEEESAEAVRLYLAANPTHRSGRDRVLSCAFDALGLVSG